MAFDFLNFEYLFRKTAGEKTFNSFFESTAHLSAPTEHLILESWIIETPATSLTIFIFSR